MWLPPSGETQSTPAPAASPSLPQGAGSTSWPPSPEQVLARLHPSELARLKEFVTWWKEWSVRGKK
jgi:hypothetical protein